MEFNRLPNEFYPTPPELAAKMVNSVFIKRKIETILEPSAGSGLIFTVANTKDGCRLRMVRSHTRT